jgi:hypothetical protein
MLKPTLKTAEHPRTDISKPALLTRNARYPITLVLPQLLPDVIQLRPRPVVVGFMVHTRPQTAGPQYFIVLPSATESALISLIAMKSFTCREASRLLCRPTQVQRAPIATRNARRWGQAQQRGFCGTKTLLAVKPYLLADIGEGPSVYLTLDSV